LEALSLVDPHLQFLNPKSLHLLADIIELEHFEAPAPHLKHKVGLLRNPKVATRHGPLHPRILMQHFAHQLHIFRPNILNSKLLKVCHEFLLAHLAPDLCPQLMKFIEVLKVEAGFHGRQLSPQSQHAEDRFHYQQEGLVQAADFLERLVEVLLSVQSAFCQEALQGLVDFVRFGVQGAELRLGFGAEISGNYHYQLCCIQGQ